MRRIAYLFLGLCLTVGMVGCEGDTATEEPTTPPADGATDTDATDDAAAPADGAAPGEDAATE